jgi:hypothetical protein
MVTGARRSKSKAASVIDSNRPRWRVRHRSTPGSQPVPFRTMDRSLSHVNTSHEGVAFTLRRPSESRPYRHLWAVSTGVEVSTFTPLLGRSPTEASQCRLLVPGRRRFGQKASRSTASAWRHRLHSKASPFWARIRSRSTWRFPLSFPPDRGGFSYAASAVSDSRLRCSVS